MSIINVQKKEPLEIWKVEEITKKEANGINKWAREWYMDEDIVEYSNYNEVTIMTKRYVFNNDKKINHLKINQYILYDSFAMSFKILQEEEFNKHYSIIN